jgi:hypothetical protein
MLASASQFPLATPVLGWTGFAVVAGITLVMLALRLWRGDFRKRD